jgi:hypothetical protein
LRKPEGLSRSSSSSAAISLIHGRDFPPHVDERVSGEATGIKDGIVGLKTRFDLRRAEEPVVAPELPDIL